MFEVTVHVQVGVTPELAQIATAFLNRQPAAVEAPKPAGPAAPAAEAPAEEETTQQQTGARRGRPKKTADPAPAAAAEEQQAPAEEAAAPGAEATGDMPDEVFYPQEEDVRTAMHKCRERIEGEDYKDKPSDDLHRAVTDVFKEIANALSGQKKPSALPQEKRQAFIDATRTIQRSADGKFTYTLAQ